jgi:hypothetical protein
LALRWYDALTREEVKWRRGWVVRRVAKVVGVGLSGEGGGWSVAVVQIQFFDFSSRREVIGWSIARRWSRCNELVLAPSKENMTRRGGVTISVGGDDTGEEKGRR